MKDLSTAIHNRFKETDGGNYSSFYNAVGGKLYKERAEPKSTLPYAVYHIISNTPDWMFGNTFFEKTRIQFDLYSESNSSGEVEDMYTYLKALFDWCKLSISGNDHLYMRRESARLLRDSVDDVWQYIVDYEIMMERA